MGTYIEVIDAFERANAEEFIKLVNCYKVNGEDQQKMMDFRICHLKSYYSRSIK